MKQFNVETAVGVFLLLGFLSFVWLAVRLGDIGFFEEKYTVTARFGSVAGLQSGAMVQIAGVRIGEVSAIRLDPEFYEAVVHMRIQRGVELPEDSIASIRSTGIIGDRYVSISPGGSPEILGEGGVIIETESSISLEELISRYIFESNQ